MTTCACSLYLDATLRAAGIGYRHDEDASQCDLCRTEVQQCEKLVANTESAILGSNKLFDVDNQGWGLLSEISPFRYFPHAPLLSKQTLAIEYQVYIWQVSPQLSCR